MVGSCALQTLSFTLALGLWTEGQKGHAALAVLLAYFRIIVIRAGPILGDVRMASASRG